MQFRGPLALMLVGCLLRTIIADPPIDLPQQAGNARVAEIFENFVGRGVQPDDSQPTPADRATEQFRMRHGLQMELVTAEPEISQPLFLTWDSRGRMWVVQYRQYQYPAGLKVVRYDHHLRAVFDKVPPPPPHGPRGEDRITVFEDTNGDGKYDQSKDVITGLNIVSSVQIGSGGIWVLNPPYLLFYPDRDGDDIPDSDPEVHLSGFGLQDTHSVANSLIWGPDGWLYAANGSTTQGTVSSEVTKGVRFQGQCIWRYHPESKVFEIYAEGGGNTFSCEIDAKGRVFSGTNSGSTRGLYYPQGAYFRKNWGKHGPLTNPYAFGFFEQMRAKGDSSRFPQAFLIYQGGLFPDEYDGTIVSPNAMQNLVWHSKLIPDGSYFETEDYPNLAESPDRWFRPVYTGVGPDGAVYIADWYDTRLSHISPIDNWHKESGRVYRVIPENSNPTYAVGDLRKLPSKQLIELFQHRNKWVRQRAVLELGWRDDKSTIPQLIQLVDDAHSLEALWAVNLLDAFSSDLANQWLTHANADIRRWSVRLLGDRHEAHPALVELAAIESDIHVRSQLASTAKRIDRTVGVDIVRNLLVHHDDSHDPHLPLLTWWALEAHADDFAAVRSILKDSQVWQSPVWSSTIGERLMRRYAVEGTESGLLHAEQLALLAPDEESRRPLLEGLNKAFQGRPIPTLPPQLQRLWEEFRDSLGKAGILLSLKQQEPGVVEEALANLSDSSLPLSLRLAITKVLGQYPSPLAADRLLRIATGREATDPSMQRVALQALASYDKPSIAREIARAFDQGISADFGLRSTGCRTLASRRDGAIVLLQEINEWRLPASEVPVDVVQRLRSFDDEVVRQETLKAFGPRVNISSEQKIAEIERLRNLLKHNSGDAKQGEMLYSKKCGVCHQLFGKGDRIGPPLDNYERANLKFWLVAILEPSLEIREGYQSYFALTTSGRVVTGMIESQDDRQISIRTSDNQTITLARETVEELRAIETSLMPENLLSEFSDEQIQDLFAYLQLGSQNLGSRIQ